MKELLQQLLAAQRELAKKTDRSRIYQSGLDKLDAAVRLLMQSDEMKQDLIVDAIANDGPAARVAD